MNTINISQKTKNKHLDFSHYEYIINSLIMFNASYSGKRNIGKTQFIKNLALDVGTSVSNIYSIIKDATVSIRDTHLNKHFELSALAAFQKRSKNHKIPNNSKFDKATDFISLVENEIKSNKLSSIDETINYLIIHQMDKINDMETVSTKTFYNYVHQGKTSIKPIDLPCMVRRKTKKNWKTYIPKRQKGVSITERPESVDSREAFGHWEGDLVTGPRDGQNGAYLTLLERKTRFYYMIPISSKSSKKVYMQINKLHKFYGDSFKDIFDNENYEYYYGICRWHHEKWDGRGYPEGRKGDDIPLWAQIVSIADVYDALVSPRCYKKAFSFEVALGMIVSGECGVFNPNILACFREIEGKLRTLYGSGPERLYE